MVVDWMEFYTDAIKNGWHPERTINKICMAIEETYGKEYSNEVKIRLKFLNRRLKKCQE